MAKLLTLNPNDGFHTCECEALTDFYREIDCDTFDIATRNVGGVYYDMFVDDCGLFKEDLKVSAVDKNGSPMLVGNIVFANHDEEGNTTDLTDDDIKRIKNEARFVVTQDGSFHMVVICEY